MARSRSSASSSSALLAGAAVAVWGGIAASTFGLRWMRRRRCQRAEAELSSNASTKFRNAVHALEWRAQHTADKIALVGCDGVEQYTWSDFYRHVQQFARALKTTVQTTTNNNSIGVAIHAFNEPKWFFCAVGALAAGWTVSGIYLTNSYAEAKHVLQTSNVKVLVLESAELLSTTYQTVYKDFPDLTVVLLSLSGGNGDDNNDKDNKTELSWSSSSQTPVSYEAFLKSSSTTAEAAAASNTKNVSSLLTPPSQLDPNAVTSLVYTSGTTGSPKAVQLTHQNITTVCAMMHARIPTLLQNTTIIVSYLPLSHIAAMGIDLYSSLFCGAVVHFADTQALQGSLKDTLLKVRPTLFFGVPRVWEKMAAAMQAAAQTSYSKPVTGPVLRAIGTAAKAVGRAWWSADTWELVRCCILPVPFGFFKMIAYRKVRRGCGLDRCKLLYTGAAPLAAETVQYLRSLDMPVLEVFGMSECGGAIAVCGPQDGARPIGACGRALPNGEIVIAEDGEIRWSGDNIMLGYKDQPAATRAALTESNQLCTGDLGRIDKDGYLFITGRKKDIIITAGGENIAPLDIEQKLKSILGDSVGHVVLIGDAKKFLTVLIAPAEDNKGMSSTPSSKDIEAAMKEYNDLHAKSRAQRVQKAHVFEHPFTVSSGELTPTMKVKRRFVVRKFAAEIDAMYSSGSVALVGYSSMNIGKLELESAIA